MYLVIVFLNFTVYDIIYILKNNNNNKKIDIYIYFDFDNTSLYKNSYKNSHENILIHGISYKTFIGAKTIAD